MPFSSYCHVHSVRFILGVLVSSSCASEVPGRAIAVRLNSLELECADAPPDVATDFISIPSSIEPFDPSRSQAYGSPKCSGFVFEFDNPDNESLRGAWVQASGRSSASSDALSESRCPERELEVDYWGYEERAWSKLASSSSLGSFEPAANSGSGDCHLEALIEQPAAFEKLRIVARVAQASQTYPMVACLW